MSMVGNLRGKVRLRTRLRNGGAALRELRGLARTGVIGPARRRTLSDITFYATNRCNSRCTHCGIWQQRPIVHLPLEVFQQVHDSPATDENTVFAFEGGEFLLHPQADEILSLFQGRKVDLYSHGLNGRKVKELLRKHAIPHLILSLDGRREAYKKIRGVDGYDRVVALAEEMTQERRVTISYTITPWNTLEDFLAIRRFCLERNITFGLNIMHTSVFFEKEHRVRETPLEQKEKADGKHPLPVTRRPNTEIPFASAENLAGEHPIKLEYFLGYNRWLRGNFQLPCTSIFHRIVVRPNGDIPLCQEGETGVLGNLREKRLEEIWWSAETLAAQRRRISCNQCWMSFHRYHDLMMYAALKTFIPEKVITWWMRRAQARSQSQPAGRPETSVADLAGK